MSRFEQPRSKGSGSGSGSGSKRLSESVNGPDFGDVTCSDYSDPLSTLIGGNMNYVMIGAVGICMALSIFLYREMKKMKIELAEISKSIHENEQLINNTKSIEGIEEQITQIKTMLQRMTQRPNGGPSQEQINAMKLAQAQAQAQARALPVVLEGLPEDSDEEEECKDGICEMPVSTKKEGKVLNI